MFAAITPAYDHLNHLLSANQDRRWRRKAVGMFTGGVLRVLDVAAGTGDLSRAWLRHRPGVQVLPTDFVGEMCLAGATKLRHKPGYMGCARADALALPFPDECFDGVMAGFGVRNFTDLEAGIVEMLRVLRPGGEMLVLEFFPRRSPRLDKLFNFYFNRFLPRVGHWISGHTDAYTYLPRSVANFATRDQFCSLLVESGCSRIRQLQFSGGIATAFHAFKTEGKRND
jgi:demethylmenaquinone methyltransferase/2-methoxy-6-polyprenyl-1,4-benzoquinol methylase